MNKNNQEIEIKIKIDDAESMLAKILAAGGAELKDREGLERDTMYDDGKGFFDAHRVLRIRETKDGNILTYKEKNAGSDQDNFLVRTEIETGFDDVKAMEALLNKLGYVPHRIKEKYRKEVTLDGLVIELHRMPFLGDFIEIEGDKDQIEKILPKLGLDIASGINLDYSALFENFCKANGLSFAQVPHTFEEEKKFKDSKT